MSHKPNTDTTVDHDPALQGEGNYSAARRHRRSAEEFVQSGQVGAAARKASPDSQQQARQMREAEKIGKSHARK